MGRLIDADAFKKRIGTETKIRKMMCMAIDEQPTAYDVEKVVAELDQLRKDCINKSTEFCETFGTKITDDMIFGESMGLYKAIEIVRKGGIDG